MRSVTRCVPALALAAIVALGGCNHSQFEAPEMQGPAAMVAVEAGPARLWVVEKQEETRFVSIGSGTRSTGTWRRDTWYHFSVQAFDPVAARPAWKRKILTVGDRNARGPQPSRVIGSDVEARLLGQDGAFVWLRIGDAPFALDAADGRVVADAAAIERVNPALVGLLPREARYFAFDRGLVVTLADARRVVLHGESLTANDYVPVVPVAVEPERKANGSVRIVPIRPFGEVPSRLVRSDDGWIGLYSDREAADAVNDDFGTRLRYPYTVLDEGASARRTLRRATVIDARRFDERFQRIDALPSLPGSPVFLKGRFATGADDEALRLQQPGGWLVWHSTRIDAAGRLALSRLDEGLRPLWQAPLPLSESGTANPLATWVLPGGHLLVAGGEDATIDGVRRRGQHLVSVDLADGRWHGWNLTGERPLP